MWACICSSSSYPDSAINGEAVPRRLLRSLPAPPRSPWLPGGPHGAAAPRLRPAGGGREAAAAGAARGAPGRGGGGGHVQDRRERAAGRPYLRDAEAPQGLGHGSATCCQCLHADYWPPEHGVRSEPHGLPLAAAAPWCGSLRHGHPLPRHPGAVPRGPALPRGRLPRPPAALPEHGRPRQRGHQHGLFLFHRPHLLLPGEPGDSGLPRYFHGHRPLFHNGSYTHCRGLAGQVPGGESEAQCHAGHDRSPGQHALNSCLVQRGR
mmetsp:Transcript_116517/g.340931  ORF Transcript_116517/g.340931 Transcript_116517/m.340931 type:complete len:264 (-) Transcript_116517:838-1629(-)